MLTKAKHNVPAYQRETVPFLGLNRSDDTKEGEFSYQKNLSDRRYPYLAPRLSRAKEEATADAEALFYWDGHEVVAAGGTLYLDGVGVFDVSEGPKQFAVVNTKLVIWPDQLTVDLESREAKRMHVEVVNRGSVTFTTKAVTLEPEYAYTTYTRNYKGNKVNVWTYASVSWDASSKKWTTTDGKITRIDYGDNVVGRYYIPPVAYNEDTDSFSGTDPSVKFGGTPEQTTNNYGVYGKFKDYKFVEATADYVCGTVTYGIYRTDQHNAPIEEAFCIGDVVSITNTAKTYCKENIIIRGIDSDTNTITFAENTFPGEKTTTDELTITRRVPSLDYICERENRLWGVSNKDNTIYVSALGDPTNFYDYSGDSGSFAVAVGSEGDFTGICDYGNAVLCWKERTLHKVLGDYPSNYQTATYRFSGVRAGAHKSLANVNETLFFLGVDGVYAYTGNKPSLISRALGADVLKDGVGGTDGRAYYLSVRNGEAWELLAYDTHTGLWSRSDEVQVVDFCRVGDDVKFLSGDTVYTIGGGEESVEWEAVFVPMYETLEGGKQYNRLIFRVEVPKDGWLAADVRFDGGRWTQVGIVKGKSGSVSLPVPLRRCDKFEIRLRGKGDCAVLDMVREFRLRGDG